MSAPVLAELTEPTARGRSQSWAFQQAVCLSLRDAGLLEARPARRVTVKCPGPVTPDDNADIVGVPGWSIVARARMRLDNLHAVLSIAESAAAESGHPHAAAVMPRRGHSVGDSYVVLPLKDFADIVAQLDALPAALLRARHG